MIPHKKPRKKPLSAQQKKENRIISGIASWSNTPSMELSVLLQPLISIVIEEDRMINSSFFVLGFGISTLKTFIKKFTIKKISSNLCLHHYYTTGLVTPNPLP